MYLSAIYDKFYCKRAIKEFGGEAIIIVVEVEKRLLEYDENVISDGLKNDSKLSANDLLFESLACLFGACKYRGIIKPESFVEIYNMQGEKIV